MKKILSIVLAAVMTLAMASCGSNTAQLSFEDNSADIANATSSVEAKYTSDKVLKIMPMGDSLTETFKDTSAYRNYLCQDLLDDGYDFDFVGISTRSNSLMPAGYESHCGWGGMRIEGLLDNLDEMMKVDCNVIMLMIGTNNFGTDQLHEELSELYQKLINGILRAKPDVYLFLACPIPGVTTDGKSMNPSAYNTKYYTPMVKEVAETKAALGYNVSYVDMSVNGVDWQISDWDVKTYDWVHPDAQGNKKLADHWYAAIKPTLDKLVAQAGAAK